MTGGIEAVQARISAIESRLAAIGPVSFQSVLGSVAGGRSVPGAAALSPGEAAGATPNAAATEREARLKAYMKSRNFNEGLAAEAATFAGAAEANGMDWRLGVAIAVAESSGGRYCFKPYNPFGIMGKSFSSWREAVTEVNRLISSYGFGDDPRKILARYNPAGGETYINNVIREMESV